MLHGPPLVVRLEHGTLVVRHHRGLFGHLFGGLGSGREASVVVFVPRETATKIKAVSADILVTGIHADVEVATVSGSLTLTGVTGKVEAKCVSGNVDAEGLTGRLVVKSVSGDVAVSGTLDDVRIKNVSGGVTLDLGPTASVGVKSVSGDVAVRLPADADLDVDAKSVSGRFDSAFELEGAGSHHGRMSGRIGTGRGALRATTVSGSVALLRKDAEAEAV